MKNNKLSILTNGIIKENPILVLILGTCPFLAVTTQASNAIGMGAAVTVFVGKHLRTAQDDAVHHDQGQVEPQGVVQALEIGLDDHLHALADAFTAFELVKG